MFNIYHVHLSSAFTHTFNRFMSPIPSCSHIQLWYSTWSISSWSMFTTYIWLCLFPWHSLYIFLYPISIMFIRPMHILPWTNMSCVMPRPLQWWEYRVQGLSSRGFMTNPKSSSLSENLKDDRMRSERCLMAVSRWSGQFFGMSLADICVYSSFPRPGAHRCFNALSSIPFEPSNNPFVHSE